MLTPDVCFPRYFCLMGHRWSLRIPQVFTNVQWVRASQRFSSILLGAIRPESAADRCDFSFRHGGWGRRAFRGETRNETGSKTRWREKEGARPPGYSWRTRFRLWWTHRRRPGREKSRDRSVSPEEKPATRALIAGQKKRTIKSAPGRTLPGRESWRRLFPRWEVPAIHSYTVSSPRIVFLELRQWNDNRHRGEINILVYFHRRQVDGWSVSLFDNFGGIVSTVTKDRFVIYFPCLVDIPEALYIISLRTIFLSLGWNYQWLQWISMHMKQVDLYLHILRYMQYR